MFLIEAQVRPKKPKPDKAPRLLLGIPSKLNEELRALAKFNKVPHTTLIKFIVSEALQHSLDTSQWDKLPYHTPTTPVQMALTQELKTAIATKAQELGMKRSELVREILKQYLKENSK